jgi:hypothetical protein
MEYMFEVTDPRGFIVHCTESVWYDHIVYGHSWMEGAEEDVADAIVNPLWISEDRLRANRNVYYALRSDPPRYLRVVVEFDKDYVGDVKTAFPASSGKPGEKWIWPQSKD